MLYFVWKSSRRRNVVGKRVRNFGKPWVGNVEEVSLQNDAFRRVIHTTGSLQLVVMSLKPGEDIGNEVHEETDQFIRIEKGQGEVILNNKRKEELKDNTAVMIPAGTVHNIINTGDQSMKLYTIYSPPHHAPDTVQAAKPAYNEEEEGVEEENE